jgi:hypothetical protein
MTDQRGWWAWLGEAHHQQILKFVGGAIAALAVALWTVFTFFYSPQTPDPASDEPPRVSADEGSVAVGGDVKGSTITVNGGEDKQE